MLLAVKTRNMIGAFQSLFCCSLMVGYCLIGQIVGCLVFPSLSVLLEFFSYSSLYSADNCWLQFCYLSLGHMFLSLDNKIQGFVTDVSYVPITSHNTPV